MAAMFEVEARKGPIGFFASPIYYKGEADEKFIGALGQKRKVTLKESVWVVKYGVSYDFGPWRLLPNEPEHTQFPVMVLQPYAGALFLTDDIKINLNPGLVDNGINIDKTIDFNTPVVGLNILCDLTERWALRVGGHYGGWDVSDVNETYDFLEGNLALLSKGPDEFLIRLPFIIDRRSKETDGSLMGLDLEHGGHSYAGNDIIQAFRHAGHRIPVDPDIHRGIREPTVDREAESPVIFIRGPVSRCCDKRHQ